MAKYKDFECVLSLPQIDLTDVAAARRFLIDAVNDPSFETLIHNLEMTTTQARSGPAPRGSEIEVKCSADTGGRAGCEVGWKVGS